MLDNQIVVITGACSDMGKALSHQLINEYDLLLIDINIEKLKSIHDELKSKYKSNIYICAIDFTKIDDVGRVFKSFLIENNITQIYGFVHIAGIAPVIPLKTTVIDDWYNALNINLLSAVEIIRVIMRKPYKLSLKSIVMLSSIAASYGTKAQIIYSVSKAAIESFVRGAAVELAPIRVNEIAPGRVVTNSMAPFNAELLHKFEKMHLLGAGTADHIADILYFLLSDKSSWITGQTYHIDGGVSVNMFAVDLNEE